MGSGGSDVSQIPKPLFYDRLISPIHVGSITTDQLLQYEDHEFVYTAKRAAKFLLGGRAQIGGKPHFTQLAHDSALGFIVRKLRGASDSVRVACHSAVIIENHLTRVRPVKATMVKETRSNSVSLQNF
jgi:hypothetical protein